MTRYMTRTVIIIRQRKIEVRMLKTLESSQKEVQ